MFSKQNVELTKIHYYFNGKNVEIPTISKEVYQNNYNSNIVIKRNVFGHTWVLKVNEIGNRNEKKVKKCEFIVYLWVICCIIIAILFGIYFGKFKSCTKNFIKNREEIKLNLTICNDTNEMNNDVNKINNDINQINSDTNQMNNDTNQMNNDTNQTEIEKVTDELTNLINICKNCSEDEICLKTIEFHFPVCVKTQDKRDPSGCGGLCELNVQKCKRLHRNVPIFQCVKNEYALKCDENEFSCESKCILKTQRCDGYIDCLNMKDELNCECNLNYYFHCGNKTSCIELLRRCDGILDCWDGFDELNCERECGLNKYPCLNGECIEKEQYCDGVYDCSDRTDEPFGCNT